MTESRTACWPVGAAIQIVSPVVLARNAGASPISHGAARWAGTLWRAGHHPGDREATARQHARNYTFFDAPVGMIFTMDRDMEIGSWLDLGMFLQNIMIAARAFGLDTCPQAAFAHYAATVARLLDIPTERQVIVGMALGHADPAAPENGFQIEREEVAGFARFVETPPARHPAGKNVRDTTDQDAAAGVMRGGMASAK